MGKGGQLEWIQVYEKTGEMSFLSAPDSTLSVVNTLSKIYFLLNGTTATLYALLPIITPSRSVQIPEA